ncbi:anthranilate synthase component II [Albibacterium bauzanense]|uniref:Anthranilate synthase component 2 n=1 Tax=Albibacterium bauzanense TaxID=653929 RepID=A0A4R1LW55_9SPHI|nr:aminodeoxychorismate/anthranilate synthase component II [Albibacterium bauzanense]TCK83092.1 anthranilate synthase component 2 [Albibacterium bauzanense]
MKTLIKNKVVVVDNYDSFTYNLVHLLNECGYDATVWRNDKFELKDLATFDKILLSPGPGLPSESGLLLDVIREYGSKKSILGVCLGLQAITEVYGGSLYNLKKPVHGTATPLNILKPEEILFKGIPNNFMVGRYHSWAADKANFPDEMEITAVDSEGVIMAIAHKTLDVRGVQFHPESILSEHGKEIVSNWLEN